MVKKQVYAGLLFASLLLSTPDTIKAKPPTFFESYGPALAIGTMCSLVLIPWLYTYYQEDKKTTDLIIQQANKAAAKAEKSFCFKDYKKFIETDKAPSQELNNIIDSRFLGYRYATILYLTDLNEILIEITNNLWSVERRINKKRAEDSSYFNQLQNLQTHLLILKEKMELFKTLITQQERYKEEQQEHLVEERIYTDSFVLRNNLTYQKL